jgi:hypothetical protein
MNYLIWKNRRRVDEDTDYFSFTIKKEGFPGLPLTDQQFTMLFPGINKDALPEAPESGIIQIQGLLI